MKDQLQKELKEKVKEGIKPSTLRKLKKSKSAGELQSSLNNPPSPLLQDQLKEKQKEIEQLRKQLEKAHSELKSTQEELDKSLEARIQGIKTFGQEHDKRTKAQQELNETIEEASNELVSSDKQNSALRTQLAQTQKENNRLKKELNLTRIDQNSQIPNSNPNLDYLKYALYALLTLWFTISLIQTRPKLNTL